MRITSFNVNKFCGAYGNGYYFNPKNIDFKTPIKRMIDTLLETNEDVVFLQEVTDNKFVDLEGLFPNNKYKIHSYAKLTSKSLVVAITLKNSLWKKKEEYSNFTFKNKIIDMYLDEKSIRIVSFHNTDSAIKGKVEKLFFEQDDIDIFLGDFNDKEWVNELNSNTALNYIDVVTNDMITYKPGQTAIDRIFIRKGKFDNNIVFNGITETFLSDHNLISFSLNV